MPSEQSNQPLEEILLAASADRLRFVLKVSFICMDGRLFADTLGNISDAFSRSNSGAFISLCGVLLPLPLAKCCIFAFLFSIKHHQIHLLASILQQLEFVYFDVLAILIVR